MTFFDHQVNGYAGVDFQQIDLDAFALDRALAALRAEGTQILLTLITDHSDRLEQKLVRLESMLRSSAYGDVVAGYHLEGPYLSPLPGYHGAHPPEAMKAPDRRELDAWCDAAGGRLRLITLAPEWPGSPEFIRDAVARGVRVSVGHSAAEAPVLEAAIEAGVRLCTHLGNGTPTVLPRHDNIIQRLLAHDELYAAFIPDGHHLPPAVLRNFVRAKPAEKVIFTTDCVAAAAAGPGRFQVGRLWVEVGADGVVREPGKPNFAGSSLTMKAAWANVQAFLGWTPEAARLACGERVRRLFDPKSPKIP